MARGRRRLLVAGAAAVLLLALVAAFSALQARRRAQAEADSAARSVTARDGERAAFCADRRVVVNAPVAPSGPVSVAIEFDRAFPTRDRLDYKAPYVAGRLRLSPQCAAQGVDYLVGEAYASPGASGALPRLERLRVCEDGPPERDGDFGARFRLVYGEHTTERVAASGDDLATSSVRILDTATGAELARDTLYFVNNWAGRHPGCPDARDQVAELLAKTFARGPYTPAPSASPPAEGKP